MKISTILDFIDNGQMALPEFQRGFVWNRDQIRGLFEALYKRYPVGSLLTWATSAGDADHRGEDEVAPGIVKLLLDGQQRMTSLYGVVRGEPPAFFDGNPDVFSGLHFHVGREEFAYYSPVKMAEDPLWIDVTQLMRKGHEGIGELTTTLLQDPEVAPNMGEYSGRLMRLLGILDVDLHIEEITGPDKTVDVVVEIFNRVNSGGTKLSKGDLALAKICGDWPEARNRMKAALAKWQEAGYEFNLDWLLRNVNTVVTGEAKFQHLHGIRPERIQDGLERAEKAIDYVLNLIDGRLGLDHKQVLFGRFALPIMVHFVDRKGLELDEVERDRLLFWYVQAGMWGRFSGSTETALDQDLSLMEDLDGALDRLIHQMRLWQGGVRVEPEHFSGWSLGARFYPVLYMLSRVGEARDWGSGLPLKKSLLGKMSRLEVHHIFPKAFLYNQGYTKSQVNSLANYCFLTKDTNLKISDSRPEVYFPEVEANHPGALASQWIPEDPELWRPERYLEFLEVRKRLLAEATNSFLEELLHGAELGETQEAEEAPSVPAPGPAPQILGGVESEAEERQLEALNQWVVNQGLPSGTFMHEIVDPDTSEPLAILDLVWPEGLQPGFSQPVAVLFNEDAQVHEFANAHGYRFFTSADSFKGYVDREILADATASVT